MMDAGSVSATKSRKALKEQYLNRKNSRENLDRFIPNRSAMDFEYAHYMLTQAKKGKENPVDCSPASVAYRKRLAEGCNMNRTRILAFKNKPPTPIEPIPSDLFSSVPQSKPVKPRRCIPQTSERTLDAPEILDDFYLNLLDWGSSNVLAIALANKVYLWDATDGNTSELVTVDDESGPVTSVKWAPDGRHISVGLNCSDVQLWDSATNRLVRTLRGGHQFRVGAMDWNNNILTTGGMDGRIVNNDVRVREHIVDTYSGHHQEVCGLKWSGSGVTIALAPEYTLPHSATAPSVEQPTATQQQTPSIAESTIQKAEDVVSSMLAKGFILGKDTINKAKAFDDKLQFTSTAAAKAATIDQKIGLTEKISLGTTLVNEKVKDLDQKFQVSEKTKTAFATAEQTVSEAGSAVMKNRYVLTGTAWATGLFSKVTKAAGEVGQKTMEKVAEGEQSGKTESTREQPPSSPKGATTGATYNSST